MMRRDLFSIWPEREPTPLVPVVTGDEMMEQLLEVYASLEQNSPTSSRPKADLKQTTEEPCGKCRTDGQASQAHGCGWPEVSNHDHRH